MTGLAPPPHTPRQAAQGHAGTDLRSWLHSIRTRRYRLVLADDDAVVLGGTPGSTAHPVWRDYCMLKRHQHALRVAVARTHPEWWAFASGQSIVPPPVDGVPVAADDFGAFACAACGGPADTIDEHAVAHCATHHPSTGWPAVAA